MSIPQQPAQPAVQSPAPVDNDAAIKNFAHAVLNDLEANPDVDEVRPEEQAAAEPPPQDQETPPEQEAEAETPTQPAVPMVEIEIDGEKVQVPEKFKGRFMADKDYRQKTMEVAASRKQLEQLTATATQLAQQAQQMAPYHAQLFAMDNRAQQLTQALQSRELQEDPLQFNRVQGELAILLRNRDAFAQGLHQQQNQLNQQFNQLRAQKLQTEYPEFIKQFPELAKDEVRQQLSQYVRNEGLPDEALEFLNYSTAGTKLAWKAMQFDRMVAENQKAAAKLKEQVKTLPSAAQSSRVPDKDAKAKQQRSEWQKRGGKIDDPAFSELLRAKIGR